MTDQVRVLGQAQRAVQWRSTLTGAIYRWDEMVGWQFRRVVPGGAWYAVRLIGSSAEDVHAYAGEKFEEFVDA